MADPVVRSWRRDRVLHVELHRPERRNAVSEELYAELGSALDGARSPEVGALVLSGAGPTFCAGADLKAHADRDRSPAERRAYIAAGQDVCRRLQTLAQPVVAAVQGHAIGAGAELALSADLVVCSDDAVFRFPEIGLGTFVGGGVTRRLPLLVGQQRAMQLLLLGRPLPATQALAWGLVTEVVGSEGLRDRAGDLAAELAALPPLSLRLAKEGLSRGPLASLEDALAYEADGLLACMETSAWSEGVAAFSSRDRADQR